MKGRTDLKNVWNFGDSLADVRRWVSALLLSSVASENQNHFEIHLKYSFKLFTQENQWQTHQNPHSNHSHSGISRKTIFFHHENRERWGKWFSDAAATPPSRRKPLSKQEPVIGDLLLFKF